MTTQNDWIWRIAAGVISLAAIIVFWTQAREPVKPPDPERVPTAPAKFAPGSVVFTNALPNAGQAGQGDLSGLASFNPGPGGAPAPGGGGGGSAPGGSKFVVTGAAGASSGG